MLDKLDTGEYDASDFPGFNKKMGRWCYHTFDILTGDILLLSGKNFVLKDNVRYYKNETVELVSTEILNGIRNIDDYPGFNIRFGRVFYGTQDILTEDIKLLSSANFMEYDHVLMYLDKSKHDYVPWSEFKKQFKIRQSDDLPAGFVVIPTFREQNSNDWCGSAGAFEQYLKEKGIGWFVYIKFYIDQNNVSKPLVVGKSGSLLVNQNGSDVNFSENVEDGSARRFLHEESLSWDKTRIAVFKCVDENEAYQKESELQKKMNLFGS